jgi:uncharacterized protein with HEPN domain
MKYFGVDLALVWDEVERDLPTLRPQLVELAERLAASEARSTSENLHGDAG